MKNISPVDEDYNLWVLLHQTTDAALRARQKELDQFGVSVIEVGVLVAIQAIGKEATPSEISRRIFREPHTVSALLNRMEKKGLVRKTQDLDRKNMVRVSITEKGRQAYDKSTGRKSIYKIISSLSEEERQQLRSCLEKIRKEAFKGLVVEYIPPPLPRY
jgi:DNA-binding MarR family transcriptional regulator